MAAANPKNRCPSCNEEVTNEQLDALECDPISPAQPSHWWHRECLEASHFLGGKQVPLYPGLIQFLHGKTYMFRCHLCDKAKPPLPVQLLEQNMIDKDQLIKYGAYTKEVRQYITDHKLDASVKKKTEATGPPVSLPQATPVSTSPVTVVTSTEAQAQPPPPVPPLVPSVSVSGDTDVVESSSLVVPEKPNDLAITEVDRQHNISQESLGADLVGTPPPNPQPPFNFPTSLGGASVILPSGGIHFGQVPPQILAQANQGLVQSNVASGGIMSHGGGVGPMSQAPGQMQNAPVIPQPYQPYQPPANMYYNPVVAPPHYPPPAPYSDPSLLIQMMQKQQQMFLEQQNLMYERMERERRVDEERRRQEADRRDREQREFMERVFQTQQASGHHSNPSSTPQNPQTHSGFAKPKFKLPTFSGDVLEWTSYWDMFVEGVHNNPNFRIIEKLHALFESLGGRAKKAVENYKLEAQNYQAVIDVLKDRFDDKIKIKAAHFQSLMNLPAAHSAHPSKLQTFLDSVNLHARGLESLENGDPAVVDAQCIAIVPCLFEKLPLVIRSQVYDSGGPQVCTHLSQFRETLRARVKVQESIYGNSWLSSAQSDDQSGSGLGSSDRNPQRSPTKPRRTGADLLASETEPPSANPQTNPRRRDNNPDRTPLPCLFCGTSNHKSTFCPVCNTIESRKKKMSERNMCFLCLKKDHSLSQCPQKNKFKCFKCSQKDHHYVLCPLVIQKLQEQSKKPRPSPGRTESGQLTVEEEFSSEGACVQGDEDVDKILSSTEDDIAMQTAVITVKNPKNNESVTANVLEDTGCKRTYISQRLADLLSLKPHKKCWRNVTTFNAPKSRKVQAGIAEVQLQSRDGSYIQLTANIIDHIANSVSMDGFLLSETDKAAIKKVKMADPHFSDDRAFDIDMVIGSDFYAMLLCGGKIQLQKSGVFLLETVLGWVTSGIIRDSARLPHSKSHSETENLALFVHESPNPVVLEEDSFSPLEDVWKFETLGIKDPKVSDVNDHIALQQFNDTVKYNNGRVSVTWLKKPGIEKLPSNFHASLKRLRILLNLLQKNPQYHEKYIQCIVDWFEREMIEKVTPENDNPDFQKHYIPHHPVFRQDSKTTKMRIVLDGSSRTKTGKSLNDYLYRGPNFLCDLGGLLLRFRLDPIGLISDFEKAFLMVELQEAERDLTRFLWLKDPHNLSLENNLQIYRFKRVPFGFKTSPFLLAGSIWNILNKAIGPEIPIAEKIRQNIYVDNVITGVRSVSDAKKFYKTAKNLFVYGSMNLREWNSNSPEVMSSIPEHDRDERTQVKVLGMTWDRSQDSLSISTKPISEFLEAKTKRQILACCASIFDPLGFVSCIKIQGMIFLQDIWRAQMGWDDPLPESLLSQWSQLCETLNEIPRISLPRHLCNISPDSEVTLLVFSDASPVAFSANVYVRTEHAEEGVKVGLAFSKARLCPVSGLLSIPRSELMGSLIGTRCANYVKRELGVDIKHTYLWTDSQCVLGWIRNEARDQGVFVSNRITEILNNQNITFSYIPSEQNPADLCTKSRPPGFEIPWDLWFEGPPWLTLPPSEWPKFETQIPSDGPTLLGGGSNPKNLKTGDEESTLDLESVFDLELYRSSSFMGLVRVTAWVRRFVSNVREKVRLRKSEVRVIQTRSQTKKQAQNPTANVPGEISPLCSQELRLAQNIWFESVQRKAYPELFTSKIHRSVFAQNLKLTLGEDNLLRSRGRLEESILSHEAKNPILLPPKSEITHMIVFSYHKHFLHSGVNYTLSHVRSKFWIPQGRKIISTILRSCMHCKKFHAAPYARPPMPNLPKERVSKASPFTYTGVDYLGPLYHQTERGESKSWVVLLTCFSIRAVHLELVPDMTGETLLCALRRFVSRRGKPSTMFSDNAKQFKIIHEILKQTQAHNPIDNFMRSEGISWKFIPELSPWHGSAWERLVGVVKGSLKKALGKTTLNFDQLRTVLVEVEGVVNSRPLTFVNMSQGDDDMHILTPQNFLSTGRNERLPILPDDDPQDPEYIPTANTQSQITQNWRQSQFYLNKFWDQWQNMYLPSLRERHTSDKFPKLKSEVFRAPEVGEIVLVKEEGLPRGQWKMGRIVEVHPGRDSLIRSAKIKIPSSKQPITRPVSLLFPLEIKAETCGDKKENVLLACEPSLMIQEDSCPLESTIPLSCPSSTSIIPESGESEGHVHSLFQTVRGSSLCAEETKSRTTVTPSTPKITHQLHPSDNRLVRAPCGTCMHLPMILICLFLLLFFSPTICAYEMRESPISPSPCPLQKIPFRVMMSDYSMEDSVEMEVTDEQMQEFVQENSLADTYPSWNLPHAHKPYADSDGRNQIGAAASQMEGPPVFLDWDGWYYINGERFNKCGACERFYPDGAPECICQLKARRLAWKQKHPKKAGKKKGGKATSGGEVSKEIKKKTPFPTPSISTDNYGAGTSAQGMRGEDEMIKDERNGKKGKGTGDPQKPVDVTPQESGSGQRIQRMQVLPSGEVNLFYKT